MLKDIVEARPAGGYKLYLRFEDGVEGEIDLSKLIEFKGIFAGRFPTLGSSRRRKVLARAAMPKAPAE